MADGIINFCKPCKDAFAVVERFETEFARRIGVKYCIAVNSGYSALFLALKAIGVGSGDEVIVPDFTMIATANAVHECGARPVFVDVDHRGNIDVDKIKIAKKTKAIIGVHVYGHPFNAEKIKKLCKYYGIHLIEDAAEGHGARTPVGNVGALGTAGCFSFYTNKIISTGEGGAITTNDKAIAEQVRKLRSYCFTSGYEHSEIGYGFRMNPYGAQHGIKMLREWNKHTKARIKIANWYNTYIQHGTKPYEDTGYTNVYWMYGLIVERKNELRKHLLSHGVETRDFFYPMSLQKPYGGKLVGSRALYLHENGILLPTMVKHSDVKRISMLINSFYGTDADVSTR
jgi:perosamine synthetase